MVQYLFLLNEILDKIYAERTALMFPFLVLSWF